MFVEFTVSQTMEHFLACHEHGSGSLHQSALKCTTSGTLPELRPPIGIAAAAASERTGRRLIGSAPNVVCGQPRRARYAYLGLCRGANVAANQVARLNSMAKKSVSLKPPGKERSGSCGTLGCYGRSPASNC
jgi:hypothetical protein